MPGQSSIGSQGVLPLPSCDAGTVTIPILLKKGLVGRQMEELASSYGFPASAFPKEGFSLNTHFVLTLTVHGSGMTFVTAEAPWKDLLSSGLFPGSSGKVSVFSHWPMGSSLVFIVMEVVFWLSAVLLSFFLSIVRTWVPKRDAFFLEDSMQISTTPPFDQRIPLSFSTFWHRMLLVHGIGSLERRQLYNQHCLPSSLACLFFFSLGLAF